MEEASRMEPWPQGAEEWVQWALPAMYSVLRRRSHCMSALCWFQSQSAHFKTQSVAQSLFELASRMGGSSQRPCP